MTGIYFSGTGNTRHCMEVFVKEMDPSAKCISIEDEDVMKEIVASEFIVIGYPIYYSNLPKIVSDFFRRNKKVFVGKKIFILVTMALFSGDGTGCLARILYKCDAEIVGGLHLKMPDSIGDEKLLKRTVEENRELVKRAQIKLKKAASDLKNNHAPQEGLGFFYHVAGLFGQRLWFYGKTKNFSNKLKIDEEKCVGCGFCISLCPMKNLAVSGNTAYTKNLCTLCYRCVNNCPRQAITLLGKTLHEQCRIEKYL